jgi:predicted ester cyclase
MTANALAEQVWAGVYAGRMAELGDLFAEGATMSTATSGGEGIPYVIGVFGRHHESYPDLKHEIRTVIEDGTGSLACRELEFTGTHLGELRNPRTGEAIPPTGNVVRWTAAEIVRAVDGKIVSWNAYFDRMALLEQLRGAHGVA